MSVLAKTSFANVASGLTYGASTPSPPPSSVPVLRDPLPVDSIAVTDQNPYGDAPINGKIITWALLTKQNDGQNGVYKNDHTGAKWQLMKDLNSDGVRIWVSGYGNNIWQYVAGRGWLPESGDYINTPPTDRVVTVADNGPFGGVTTTGTTEVKQSVPNVSMPPKVDPLAGSGTVPNAAVYTGPSVLNGTLPGNTGINPGGGSPLTASGADLMPSFLKDIDPMIIVGVLAAVAVGAYFIIKKR